MQTTSEFIYILNDKLTFGSLSVYGPAPALSAWNASLPFILIRQLSGVDSVIVPILQMRRLRLKGGTTLLTYLGNGSHPRSCWGVYSSMSLLKVVSIPTLEIKNSNDIKLFMLVSTGFCPLPGSS